MSRTRVSILAAASPASPSPHRPPRPTSRSTPARSPRTRSAASTSASPTSATRRAPRPSSSTSRAASSRPPTKRVWGWTAKVSMRKLATPVPSADGDITEEVAKITYRATSKADWILPGQFEEFGLSMRIPNTPELDAELPGPPDLQQRRGRQLERCRGSTRAEQLAPRRTLTRGRAAARSSRPPPTRRSRASRRSSNSTRTRPSATSARRSRPRCRPGSSRSPRRAGPRSPLKSSGLMSSNKAVVRAVPKSPLRLGHLQGQLARPRRRRPLREGHLELQGEALDSTRMRAAAPWVVLGAATAAAALALSAVGFPSPTLFSALIVGLAAAPHPPAGRPAAAARRLPRRAGRRAASRSAPTCSPRR